MTEEFIRANFCEAEIAKQMRELGFNEECTAYYHDSYTKLSTYPEINNYILSVYTCAAPTYWQAIQWLRGKGIQIIEAACLFPKQNTRFWCVDDHTGNMYPINEAISKALSILKQQQNTNT